MGLDAEKYPPFRVGVFNNAYDLTGYGGRSVVRTRTALYDTP